jgi:hypothetical protein
VTLKVTDSVNHATQHNSTQLNSPKQNAKITHSSLITHQHSPNSKLMNKKHNKNL